MRVRIPVVCLWCLSQAACGSDRFESVASTQTAQESSEAPETEEPDTGDGDVNVNVTVEVNVDGKPTASASASATNHPAPETDAGDTSEDEDAGEFVHLPIPTSFVPQPPATTAPDAGSDAPESEAPDSAAPPVAPLWEPVPVVVLDDSTASFREWFLAGYNFDSQRFEREEITGGGFAAHATVTGNQDYTLAGVLFDGPNGEPRGAQDFDGVAFWVCGSLGALRFEVPTEGTKDATQSFGTLVDVTRQWKLVTVAWSDLGQDTPTHTFDVEAVRGLYFTVVDEDYELWLHSVQFWSQDLPIVGSSPTGSCL